MTLEMEKAHGTPSVGSETGEIYLISFFTTEFQEV